MDFFTFAGFVLLCCLFVLLIFILWFVCCRRGNVERNLIGNNNSTVGRDNYVARRDNVVGSNNTKTTTNNVPTHYSGGKYIGAIFSSGIGPVIANINNRFGKNQ